MEINTLEKRLETDPIEEFLTQGETGIDRFVFRISRYYCGTDLSGFTFRLRGISDQMTIAETYLTETADGDELLLEWLVTREFTAVPGKIRLELSAISPDQQKVLKLTSRDIKIRESLWGSVPPDATTAFEKSLLDIQDLKENSLYKNQLRAGQGILLTKSGEDIFISNTITIDDSVPSAGSCYSSQKLEEEFLRRGETTDGAATKTYVDEEMKKALALADYDPNKTGTVNSARKIIPTRITASASAPKLLSDITDEGEYICPTSGEANGFTDRPWNAFGFRLSVHYVRLDKSFAGNGANDPAIRQEFVGYSPTAQKCPYVRYLHWNVESSTWDVGPWKPIYDGFLPPTAAEVGALPLNRLGYESGQVPVVDSTYSLIDLPQYLNLHNQAKEATVKMPYTVRLYGFTDGGLIMYVTDSSTTEHKNTGYFRFTSVGRIAWREGSGSGGTLKYFYNDDYKPYAVGTYTGNGNSTGNVSQQINLGFAPTAVIVAITDGTIMAVKSGTYQGGNGLSITDTGFTVSGKCNDPYPAPHFYIAFR